MADLSSILAGTADLQTPEEVERRRRQGTQWLNQGSSVAPVAHWTQALARGVQGGLGGYELGQARDQEQRGKAVGNEALVSALTGKQSPNEIAASALKNPWTADFGRDLATRNIAQRMQENSPAAQLALKKAQLEYDMAKETRPLELQKLQLAIKALEEQSAQDRWIFGEARAAGAGGPAATPSAPMTSAPVLQGTSFGPWQAGAQTPSATPTAANPLDEKTIRTVLAGRPMADRQMFLSVYQKDRSKAMELIKDWSDPNKEQEKARQKEAGEAQGKAQAALPSIRSSTDALIKKIDDVLYEADAKTGQYKPDPANPGQFLPNKRLNSVIGPFDGSPWVPDIKGTTIAMRERLNQIYGGAFLQAYNDLRGAGSVTENEAAPATAALARLKNMRQDEGSYREALADFRKEVMRLRKLGEDRASGKVPMPEQGQTTTADPLAAARDAIAKGAPRDQVEKRLRENGIDPAGL